MATRDQVKTELEKVEDEYLEVVYRTVLSLETPPDDEENARSWKDFVASTYGSLTDAPIARGEQGELEVRDLLR